MAEGDSPYPGVKNPYDNKGEAKPSLLSGLKGKLKKAQEGQPDAGKANGDQGKEKPEAQAGKKEKKEGEPPSEKKEPKKEAKPKKAEGIAEKEAKGGSPEKEGKPDPKKKKDAEGEPPAQEAGASQQKKGIFAKLSEKLGKKNAAQPAGENAKPEEGEKAGILKKLFKKKEKEEEPISLAPTIVNSKTSAPEEKPAASCPSPYEEGIITPTVAPVPQQTFFQKLKGLFKKEPRMPLEIPTHCAVCGIDLHTVYAYSCSNCRKVACYYCMRTFDEKTYCTRCLKEKGIL